MCGSRQTDRRDDTGSSDGLGSAKSNLGKTDSHINHPAGLPIPLISVYCSLLHDQGIPADLWLLRRSPLAMMLLFRAPVMILHKTIDQVVLHCV